MVFKEKENIQTNAKNTQSEMEKDRLKREREDIYNRLKREREDIYIRIGEIIIEEFINSLFRERFDRRSRRINMEERIKNIIKDNPDKNTINIDEEYKKIIDGFKKDALELYKELYKEAKVRTFSLPIRAAASCIAVINKFISDKIIDEKIRRRYIIGLHDIEYIPIILENTISKDTVRKKVEELGYDVKSNYSDKIIGLVNRIIKSKLLEKMNLK